MLSWTWAGFPLRFPLALQVQVGCSVTQSEWWQGQLLSGPCPEASVAPSWGGPGSREFCSLPSSLTPMECHWPFVSPWAQKKGLFKQVSLPGSGRKPWVSVSGMGFETKERQRFSVLRMETLGYVSAPTSRQYLPYLPKQKFQVGGLACGGAWYRELLFYSRVSLYRLNSI